MNSETKLIRFDWAIKTVLRDKANFDILEGFLSALLEEEISILELLESESNQADLDQKFNRVDLLVKDSQQRQFIIEVQNQRMTAYLERVLFGVSKVIVENLELGGDYRDVKKVISISILYFNLGLGKDYVYRSKTEFEGIHTHQPLKLRRLIDGKWHEQNIFPEYYLLNVESFEDVIASDLDEWIYLLKHSATRPEFKAKHIDKAQAKLAVLSMTAEERRRYEQFLMNIATDRDVLQTARREGLQEGLQKGLQEGLQKGLKEGLQKGEMATQLAIAQKLRNTGMAVDTIAEMTGVARDVVESLESNFANC
jgi:predicted transposase/invertase (TIGR01784 family)